MTIVAIGCSTYTDYSFLIPFTALAWRDVVGFTPRIFLVGKQQDWATTKHLQLVIDKLKEFDIDHRFVPFVEPWGEATIAQNIRQHAAADRSISNDEFVMVADADLWPLQKDWYRQHLNYPNIKACCLYINGDHFVNKFDVVEKVERGLPFQSIPTCHVVMRAHEWRSTYDYKSNSPIAAMGATLRDWFDLLSRCGAVEDRGFATWMSDQRIISYKLCKQPWFPEWRSDDKNCERSWLVDDVLFVTRHGHPPLNRLDRAHLRDWQGSFLLNRWVDAHVHKSPMSDEHWPGVLEVIKGVMPDHVTWADRYRNEFVSAM